MGPEVFIQADQGSRQVLGHFPQNGSFSGWSWQSDHFHFYSTIFAVGSSVYVFGLDDSGDPAGSKYFRWEWNGALRLAESDQDVDGWLGIDPATDTLPEYFGAFGESAAYLLALGYYWEFRSASAPVNRLGAIGGGGPALAF